MPRRTSARTSPTIAASSSSPSPIRSTRSIPRSRKSSANTPTDEWLAPRDQPLLRVLHRVGDRRELIPDHVRDLPPGPLDGLSDAVGLADAADGRSDARIAHRELQRRSSQRNAMSRADRLYLPDGVEDM